MTEFCKFLIYETTRFLAPVPVAVEWVIAILGALAVALIPLRRGLPRLRRAVHALSERRRWAIIICGLLPVAVRLSLLAIMPAPEPSIHDEFSHLLLGDTLAHGRLANAPHPMWRHFESIHIIQQPTYSSMYPPAQGVFLAAGEVMFHEPWAGVVISVGLMGMAVCWMMQGWLPPAWAFYGALLCGLKLGIGGLWINSYIGGAAGAIGGALLFGALPRLRRGRRGLDAALFGLGMVILMNSRPFDGAILSAASIAYLLWVKKQRAIVDLLPAAAVLAIGVAFTGYYDWRVTGSPLRMAYQVNRDTYGWPENLAFLPTKKLTLRDPVMESMYLKEVARREVYQHPDKLADDYVTRLFDNWSYFIGPLLTVPLVFLPWILRDRRTRPLLIFVALVALLNLFQLVLYPYHLAPLVGVIFAIVTQGLRHLYVSLPRSRRVGLLLALPVCVGLTVAMKANADDLVITLPYWDRTAEWHRDARTTIAEWLKRRPGKQLVVVRYGRFHEVNQEWVYNGADIDGSKIVWAREVDPQSDAELLSYFRDREAWLLEADVMPVRVVKYPRPPAVVEKLPEISRK
jgi:hypothetical protein